MYRLAFLLFVLFIFSPPGVGYAQREVWISSPVRGEAVQGSVTISGQSAVAGFSGGDISFAYQEDPTGTWFLIASLEDPVEEAPLVTWDTSLITDGNYTLRLRIQLEDGSVLESLVTGVRVRNYTPVESPILAPENTPAQNLTLVGSSAAPAAPLQLPSSTPLPVNPAAVARSELQAALLKGAGAAAAALLILGFYLALRRASRSG